MAKSNPNAPKLEKPAFEGLLRLQCSREEVMTFFGLKSKTSLVDWVKENYGVTFEEVKQQYGLQGKIGLKRQAYQRALKSDTVLIFLLKSELHMNENSPATPEDDGNSYTNDLVKSIDRATKALSHRADLIAGLPNKEGTGEPEADYET